MVSFFKQLGQAFGRQNSAEDEEAKKSLKRNVVVTEHKGELSDLLKKFEVNANVGLSSDEAKLRLEKYGQNMLTPPQQTPTWVKFIKELTGFFSLLLWGGAILCFVGYSIDRSEDHLFLGIVLVFVVVITGVFSFVQNSKSESLMNSFKNMLPPKVKVIRDGSSDEVVALNLVPGDIVFVEGGDLIPADMRVIECSDNFNVDNAALTGESEPQKRRPEFTHEDPLETQNLCFFGTQVPEGSCKGVVISTGDKTVMGRIAALAMSTTNEQTPINKEIHHFILIISAIAIFLGVLFFVLNIIIGTPYIENLVFMIGIIVANVPEGLLATVTVCLTLTAKRMHAKKVLVKNLEGVETLGSTSCICSDKTGTLTQNIMTVAKVVYGGDNGYITDDAPSSFTNGRKTYDIDNESFKKLLRCSTLCNVASFVESSKWEVEEDGETKRLDNEGKPIPKPFSGEITQGDGSKLETIFWKPVGNASECAMIKLVQSEANAETGEGDVVNIRSKYPTKFVIPFNSKNKYQVHIHEDAKSKKHFVMMKGAPERILGRCTHVMLNGQVVEMTDEERKNIEERQESLSAEGLRCLGFAEAELGAEYNENYKYSADSDEYSSANFPLGEAHSTDVDSMGRKQNPKSTSGLVFLGLMALVDPPRPAVPAAVEKCKTAGVKVIMVTGDHPVTAQAIAYKVGILWSKTRGDMDRDNKKYGRKPGDLDYENPDDAQAIVVPGHTISVDMSEEEWDFILNHSQIVFARTSPQQKLVIVENCQRLGHIVAVTGDGVNDSPAIKKADIGIAMGIMGSEVSKNAADMILLDDNFASIVNGVEEGRLIFDNLKKSIAYTIQSNIPEITPFLVFILLAIPLPLTTFLILAIDLGTDMIPAISMAYEYPEADIMKRPPRNSKTDRLVTKRMINFSYGQIGMIQAMAGFFTYMVVLNDYGYAPHVLPFRGNNEAWGHQPLFCKFSGGHYVDTNGNIDLTRDPTVDPPTREYPFWFEGLSGEVESCYYAVNNYDSDVNPSKDFDFRDSTTYVDGSKGHRTPTIESLEANERNAYFEYIPWKSKESSFWNDKFLYWDTDDVNTAGQIGEGVDSSVYFSGSPAGLWSLCAHQSDECPEGSFCGEDGDARVRGIATVKDISDASPNNFTYSNCTDQAELTESKFSHAEFCNGQSDDNSACQAVNGYEYNDDGDVTLGFPTNRFQTFYCMGFNDESDNSCGPLTNDKDDLPFCNAIGEKCGSFLDHSEAGCDYMCKDFCYWPGSEAINPRTAKISKADPSLWGANPSSREYKQCKNIGSTEVAWESLKYAQGAFFTSIVVGQIAGLLVCKTRWLSITAQGMRNNFMLFGIGTELVLVAWLAYCKPINDALGTRDIRLVHWFCAIPFAIMIFIFDEGRKALMRATSVEKKDSVTGQVKRMPGWLERNCAY